MNLCIYYVKRTGSYLHYKHSLKEMSADNADGSILAGTKATIYVDTAVGASPPRITHATACRELLGPVGKIYL